ncbi:MAG TPA: phosphatidylglycerophosphatase A [Sedimentisphaerales bacterium]|nr:phosphatidylglycerophosphatase A [Sedimentisphaerales bacterium]
MMDIKRFFTSCFGLGRLAYAPGTWGSIPVALLFILLKHTGASGGAVVVSMLLMVVFGAVVCLKFARAVAERLESKDPREIVADEWAGQAVVFLGVAFIEAELAIAAALVGFGLFRLFDIVKPWPIRQLERVGGAIGILADDFAAGVMAMAGLVILEKLQVLAWLGQYLVFGGELNIFTAVVLGAVQGLTEFLPVSSSGHLVLFAHMFGFQMDHEINPSMLVFDLTIHMGTAVSVFVVMWRDITAWMRRLLQFGRYGRTLRQVYKRSPAVRLLILAIAANLVTGVIGLLLKQQFAGTRQYLAVVAASWVVTGVLLLATDYRRRGRLGIRQFGIWAAVAVGLAQAAALLPGLSRSGATIGVAILIGLRRRWAVEFSFLIGIPLVVLASFVEAWGHFADAQQGGVNALTILAGSASACIVGIFALKLLISATKRARFRPYAYYCFALALLVFVYVLLS